jgi:hypothetical protein
VRRRLGLGAGGAALLGGALLPAPAAAHGLVGRADLPIPPELFSLGAIVILLVTAGALFVLWQKPRLEPERWRPLPAGFSRVVTSPVVDVLAGLVGVLLLALVVWSGFAGVQVPTANFAPTFVYVVFWLGLVPLSLLVGDVFRAFNPWRAIGRGVGWVVRTASRGSALPEPLSYPERLGRWPAALGLFAFAWIELVASGGDVPLSLAIATLIYSAATFLGMALYGVDAWIERGEAFSVYFNLISRISPLERRGREVGVRQVLSGLAALPPAAGTVALLAVMIGSVTFDGFSAGRYWTDAVPGLQEFFASLGAGPALALELTFGLGLIVTILLIGGLYRLGVEGARTVGGDSVGGRLGRAFAHTLVPIAVVYAAAHYVSLLLTQGQAIGYLASDPLGEGWNLFGTAAATVDYGIIGATLTWYLQVAFVVVGHCAGIALAHDKALVLYRRPGQALASQIWMIAVMVLFTLLALWLLMEANSGV